MKAVEKKRERRYETANDFARDIERYLADEPVEASPPSMRYQLGKFARKHRVLSGFVALLALGVVGLTWGIVQVNDARQREKEAGENAVSAFLREKDERKKAENAEGRARKVDAISWAAIRAMTRSSEKLDETQKTILRRLQEAYKQLQSEPGESEVSRLAAAETEFRFASLAAAQGAADAETRYRDAIKLYKSLATEFKDLPEYRNELARCHFDLAHLLRKEGKKSEAGKEFGRAIALHKTVSDDFPDVPAFWIELARDYNNWGTLLRDEKDLAGAEKALRDAVALGEKAAAAAPAARQDKINLAAGYHNLGNIVRDQRDPKTALTWYAKAVAVLEQINPRPADATEYLRNAHWDRANALGQLGRHAEAVKDWQRAIDLERGAARDHLKLFLATSEMAEKLKTQANPSGAVLYEAAALHARAAAAAKAEDETDLQTRYGQRALELLKEAKSAGWFREPQRIKQLKEDADFNGLPRTDFTPFLDSLQAGSATAP